MKNRRLLSSSRTGNDVHMLFYFILAVTPGHRDSFACEEIVSLLEYKLRKEGTFSVALEPGIVPGT